jgi:TatA/E family protein of Tat protein translocase
MNLVAFLGTQEIVIVLLLALIVFGPQKLPDIGRQIGSAMRELKKMTGDFQQTLDFDNLTTPSSNAYDKHDWYDTTSTAQVIPQGSTLADASTAGILEGGESSYTVASEGAGSFIAPPGPAHPPVPATPEGILS